MKKTSTMLMILCLLVALTAAGCSSNNAGKGNGSQGGAAGDSANSDKKITLKMVIHDYEDKFQEIIKKYEADHPNVHIETQVLVPGGGALDNLKKLDVVIASGEVIDIISLPNVEEISKRAGTGILAPLNEMYSAAGMNPDEDFYVNPKLDGQSYSIPYTSSFWYVLLNKKHLEEAGLEVPTHGWTWDEFRDYAKKLTKGEGNDKRYGAYFHNWGEFANPIAYAERPDPYMLDAQTPNFNDSSFDYFFDLRKAMEKDDKSIKPLADVLGAKLDYKTEFWNEKASMLMIGSFTMNQAKNLEKFPHDFQTAFAPVPLASSDSQAGLTEIGGNFLSVMEKSAHKQEAFDFSLYVAEEFYKVAGFTPMIKNVDGKAFVEDFVGEQRDLFDVDSLVSTLFDPRVSALSSDFSVTFGAELKSVLENGIAKYLLDNVTIDEAKEFMTKEANAVIKKNQ